MRRGSAGSGVGDMAAIGEQSPPEQKLGQPLAGSAEQKPKSTWRDLLELVAALDLAGIIILPLIAVVAAVFWCFGISLDRPQPEWNDMSRRQKAMRLLLTAVGTTAFASPFIWFAWLLARG